MVIALDAARESAFVHFPSLPQGFAVWKPYGVGSVRDEALRQQLAQHKSETYDGESSPRVGQAVEVRLGSGVWAAGFIVPGPVSAMGDSNVYLPDGTTQLVSASRILPVGDGSGTCPFFTPAPSAAFCCLSLRPRPAHLLSLRPRLLLPSAACHCARARPAHLLSLRPCFLLPSAACHCARALPTVFSRITVFFRVQHHACRAKIL